MKHIKNNTGAIIGLILVIGVAGFFGGMKYADFQRTQARGNMNRQFQGMGTGNQTGTNGQMQGQTQGKTGLGGRPVTGEVINKDDKSITVKIQDGGSKIVMISDSTVYSKTTEGSIQDIAVGSQVGIFGTENSDKSITAQTVQLNPQFRTNATPTPKK